MMNIKKLLFSIMVSLSFINPIYPLAIIWDFENTLVRIDKLKMAKAIGLSDFLMYAFFDFKNPFKLAEEVFHLLGHINCPQSKHKLSVTNDKKKLPTIFSHWLDGSWEYHQIKEEVNTLIKSFSSTAYFDNNRHQRLIENTMKNMFDPQILSSSIKPIKPAISLLKSCILKKNDMGEQAHKPYLLSNISADLFDCYIKTDSAREVLCHIPPPNFTLSGDIGMIKPNEDIFLYFLKKYNLNPKECIFIDDQISNINAARRLGIHGILVENNNYKQIRRELKMLQVI